MRWSEQVPHVVVVLRVLVGVPYNKAYRATCRLTLEHAAQQFHLVWLFPAGSDAALSRASAVQLLLNEVRVYADACRHAVHHAADGLTVALAECGQPEYVSK